MTIIETPTTTTPTSTGPAVRFDPPLDDLARRCARSRLPRSTTRVRPSRWRPSTSRWCTGPPLSWVPRAARTSRPRCPGPWPTAARRGPATGHGPVAQCGRRRHGDHVPARQRRDRPRAAHRHVGAGVRWADVLEAAAPYGLAGVSGSSSSVGVVGYSLGGGIGPAEPPVRVRRRPGPGGRDGHRRRRGAVRRREHRAGPVLGGPRRPRQLRGHHLAGDQARAGRDDLRRRRVLPPATRPATCCTRSARGRRRSPTAPAPRWRC